MTSHIEITFQEPPVYLLETFSDLTIINNGGVSSVDRGYTFSFGDATPISISVANANDFIRTVTVSILTPFNGSSSSLSIGDAGNPNRLVPSTAIDIRDGPAEWEYNPNYRYTSQTAILLTITPDGATQGNGIIYIERG